MVKIKIRRSRPFRVRSGRIISRRSHLRRIDFPTRKKHFGYNNRAVIFVPSTQDKTKLITSEQFRKRIAETERFMRNKFRGTTRISANGTFKLDDGRVSKDDIAKVESYHDIDTWRKKDKEVEKWIQNKAREWGQESIGFEYEGTEKETTDNISPATQIKFIEPKKRVS